MTCLQDEDLECCVCYGYTDVRTPCGHLLCDACRLVLPRSICPLCRQELRPLQGLRTLQAPLGVQAVGIASHQSSTRSAQTARPPRAPRAGQTPSPRVSPVDSVEAPAGLINGSSRAASERPRYSARRSNASPGPRSPFALWLQQREARGDAAELRSPRNSLHRMTHAATDHEAAPNLSFVASARAIISSRDASPRSNTSAEETSQNQLCITQLVSRIGRMSFAEGPRFIEHVAWLHDANLVDTGRKSVLHQTLKRRLAELFSVAFLHDLMAAGDMLFSLEQTLEPCCEPLRRALEARLSYLLYHPSGSNEETECTLENLQQHLEISTRLARRHLISSMPRKAAVAHAKRWIAHATVVQIGNHISTICALGVNDTILVDAVSQRVHEILKRPLSIEKLDRLVRVLFGLEDHGLVLMDRRLDIVIIDQIRAGLEIWPPTHVKNCIAQAGGLRKFCSQPSVAAEVESLLLARIVQAVTTSSGSLKHAVDLPQVQTDFAAWNQLAKVAIGAGFLKFDGPSCGAVIEAVTKCTARCMASSEFSTSMKEVQGLEWVMTTLLAQGQRGQANV